MKHTSVLLHGSKTVKPFVPFCGSLSSSEIRYGKPNTSTPSTRYDSCEWHVRAATSLFLIHSLSHTHTHIHILSYLFHDLIYFSFNISNTYPGFQALTVWPSGYPSSCRLNPALSLFLSLFLCDLNVLRLSEVCLCTWTVSVTFFLCVGDQRAWWLSVWQSVNMLSGTAVEKLKEATILTRLHTLVA